MTTDKSKAKSESSLPDRLWRFVKRFTLITFLVCLFLLVAGIVGFNLSLIEQRPYWTDRYTRENPEWAPAIKLRRAGVPNPDSPVPDRKAGEPPATFYNNLCVIEFDEYGDFWDKKQLDSAGTLIGQADSDPHGTPIIVFVHGWRNNADPSRKKNDLIRFSDFMHRFEKDRVKIREKMGLPTDRLEQPVGIYIGWRGRTIDWKGLDLISFPGRRLATNRVSSNPALHRCLWELRRRANLNRSDNRMIMIGHSFGGRILERLASPHVLTYHNTVLRENALENEIKSWRDSYQKTFVDSDFFASNPDPKTVRYLEVCNRYITGEDIGIPRLQHLDDLEISLKEIDRFPEEIRAGINLCRNGLDYRNRYLLADLTLLINPATEGINARQLNLATQHWHDKEKPTPPAIISLTSETDRATGIIWPVGKWLEQKVSALVPRSVRNYPLGSVIGREPQKDYLTHTPGHDRRLVSGFINQSHEYQAYPKVFECITRTSTFQGIRSDSYQYLFDGVAYNTKSFRSKPKVDLWIERDSQLLLKMGQTKAAQLAGPNLSHDELRNSIRKIVENEIGSNRYLSHKLSPGGHLVLRVDSTILSGHGGDSEHGIFNSRMVEVCEQILIDTEPANFENSKLWEFLADFSKHEELSEKGQPKCDF